MSGYYDPHPRYRLYRTVVVAGQIGCGAPAISRHVASRTGLPFTEVDRLIEHQVGSTLARLVVEEGRSRLAERADEIVERLADRLPRGLVVLDQAWPSPAVSRVLREEALLVHVRRPPTYLLGRLAHEVRRSGDWILDGVRPVPEDESGLKPLLEQRAPLLDASHIVVEAGDAHAQRVAEILLESFERLPGAEAL